MHNNLMEVKNCPFCGSNNIGYGSIDGFDNYLGCNTCRAQGPRAEGDYADHKGVRSKARDQWNNRSETKVNNYIDEDNDA